MEQLALFHESTQLFKRASDHAWFSVDQKHRGRFFEDLHPIARMPEVLSGLDYSVDTYISQHCYHSPQRLLATLSALSCAHLDIDYYKSEFAGFPVSYVMEQALYRCECEGIPLPSIIIDSGRGLYLKWLWLTPLRGTALPRWQAVERALLKSFQDFEADKGATLGTQILRIEGSRNTKCDRVVGPIWTNGPRENPVRYDFDEFCDLVLPYSRVQAQAYKAEMAQRGKYLEEIKQNAALRSARLGGNHKAPCAPGPAVAKQIEQDLAGELWANRYDWIKRLANHRFNGQGVPDGAKRDEFCWLAANALAWQTKAPKEILATIQQLVPTYSLEEAKSSAAAVLNRLTINRHRGLYTITNRRLIERLAVTDGELAALGSPSGSSGLARSKRPNEGILRQELDASLGVMRGLSFDEYMRQTRERQRLGAEYVNTERKADTRARIIQAVAELQRAGKKPTGAAIARATGLDRAGLMRNHRDLIPLLAKV